MSLQFDQGVIASSRSIVVTANGVRLDNGQPQHPSGDSTTLTVALSPGPARASYDVVWRVGSADGHAIDGAFSFGVGEPAGPAPSTSTVAGSSVVAALDEVAEALAYAGLVLAVGSALTVGALWPTAASSSRVRSLIAGGWAVEVLATIALLALRGPVTAGTGVTQVFSGFTTTLDSRSGRLLLLRLVVLILMLPALRRLLGRGSGATVDLGVLGLIAIVSFPLGDHAGTGPGAPLAVTLGTFHVLAATLWLGGLAVLLCVRDVPLARWSHLASACVLTLIVTGVAASYHQVGSWAAFQTHYGTVLIVKMAVVVGFLGVANIARRVVTAGREPSRKGIAVEAIFGAVTLGITAVLVAAQPAREAYPAPTVLRFPVTGASTLSAVVHIDRTRVGPETLTLSLTDARGNPFAGTVDGVLADRNYEDDPVRFPFVAGNPGHSTASVELPEVGSWQLALEITGTATGDYAGQATYIVS